MKINSVFCCQLLCIIFHTIQVFICMTYPASRDFPHTHLPPNLFVALRTVMWSKLNFLFWIRPFFYSVHRQENLLLAFSRRLGKHARIWLLGWIEIEIEINLRYLGLNVATVVYCSMNSYRVWLTDVFEKKKNRLMTWLLAL